MQHMDIAHWITKLQTHTPNMLYFLLFHATNGYVNAPQCYIYMYTAGLVRAAPSFRIRKFHTIDWDIAGNVKTSSSSFRTMNPEPVIHSPPAYTVCVPATELLSRTILSRVG